jgi:hypothetical protein
VQCLIKPDWDFCASFQGLCSKEPDYHFKSMDHLERAVCASDKKFFCNNTEHIEANMTDFCENADKLSDEVRGNSSIDEFCASRAYAICAYDPVLGA